MNSIQYNPRRDFHLVNMWVDTSSFWIGNVDHFIESKHLFGTWSEDYYSSSPFLLLASFLLHSLLTIKVESNHPMICGCFYLGKNKHIVIYSYTISLLVEILFSFFFFLFSFYEKRQLQLRINERKQEGNTKKESLS